MVNPDFPGVCFGLGLSEPNAMTNTCLSSTGKVKLLLKELWLCINTTHRLPGEGGRCIPGEGEASRASFHTAVAVFTVDVVRL